VAGLVLIAAAGVLSACGAKTEDLRYREAREMPALQVPPDLDRPRETALMKIPPPSPDATPDSTSGATSGSPLDSGPSSTGAAADGDMGRPPNLLPNE